MIFTKTSLFAGILILIAFVSACQTQPNQIFIEIDDTRQALVTEAATVREALQEADVELGSLDRVEPDLYVQLEPGLTIVVTRVSEEVRRKVLERGEVWLRRALVVDEWYLSAYEPIRDPRGENIGILYGATARLFFAT